jgi:hypothetical protein
MQRHTTPAPPCRLTQAHTRTAGSSRLRCLRPLSWTRFLTAAPTPHRYPSSVLSRPASPRAREYTDRRRIVRVDPSHGGSAAADAAAPALACHPGCQQPAPQRTGARVPLAWTSVSLAGQLRACVLLGLYSAHAGLCTACAAECAQAAVERNRGDGAA